MQTPVDITFREIEKSEAVEARINEYVGKLERFFDRIIRVEVLVETPHRHHQKGRQFHVRVRVVVPGYDIVTSHDPGPDQAHEDVYVALRDTFNATRRQLEDYVRKSLHRGDVPREQSGAMHGRVTFIDVEKEWGWIEPDDGRRIYFHSNSVLGGVDGLHVGDEVRFTEESGREGPQASTVAPIGNNGRHAMTAM
ncbi:MAG: HPF/RaiA family ribosome-associated protein [Kofleriaceae bacterium]|nr:HPF/RaiA family ribosome-associated protein [Kofleriaceae bacterium]